MGYKAGLDRDQAVLFPATLDEYVSDENPVRVIDVFVDLLDLGDLGFLRAEPSGEGRPAYDPRAHLRLYIYGYVNRTRSSRALERETHRNVEVMWLMRMLKPDHKTIAEFRRVNADALKGVMRQFILTCRGLGLLGGERVFIDGTKIRTVNGKDRNFSDAKLAKLIKAVDDQIEEYLSELDEQDVAEAKEPGATDPELKEKVKALRERKKKYERYRNQLKESGERQMSLTDPESRRMKIQGDMKVCYNAQIAVDSKHHLIVVTDVTDQGSDEQQLAPMAKAAKEALGGETLEAGADAGYHVGKPGGGVRGARDHAVRAEAEDVVAQRREGEVHERGLHLLRAGECVPMPGGAVAAARREVGQGRAESPLFPQPGGVRGMPAAGAVHGRQAGTQDPAAARGRADRGNGRAAEGQARADAGAQEHRGAPVRDDEVVGRRRLLPAERAEEGAGRVQPDGAGVQPEAGDQPAWGEVCPGGAEDGQDTGPGARISGFVGVF